MVPWLSEEKLFREMGTLPGKVNPMFGLGTLPSRALKWGSEVHAAQTMSGLPGYCSGLGLCSGLVLCSGLGL